MNPSESDPSDTKGSGSLSPSIVGSVLVFLGFACAAMLLFSVLTLRPYPYARSLLALVLLGGVLLPELALCGFFFALALFGNKPNTLQFHYLILSQSALVAGLAVRNFFENLRFPMLKEKAHSGSSSWVWFALVMFSAISFLSLSSLPIGVLFHEVSARAVSLRPQDISASIFSFLSIVEDKQGYAVLSVFLTLLSLSFSWLLMQRVGRFRERMFRYGWAILSGLIVSLVFGIADYYKLLDLKVLRGLDPMVNPGDAQFRLQSFFGHSGWFAEFVTMTVPFGLLILLERTSFAFRVLQILILLLLGEFALILTFQRGGWLSYPLTLVAIWGALYVLRRLERGETRVLPAIRGSILKVLLSVPLTILISVACINFGMKSGSFTGDVKVPGDYYLSRLEAIGKTSDRTDFMVAAYRIASLHPLLGAGSESFGYQFHKEFERADGHFPNEFDLPLHGTAHSLYFQVLSGKGIFGLLALLMLLFVMLVPPLQAVIRDDQRKIEEKIFLLLISCFTCSVVIYGLVQEVFYIHALQVLFFAVAGIAAVLLSHHKPSAAEARLLWRGLVLIFALHLLWEKAVFSQIESDFATRSGVYGCFVPETGADGREFSWCAPKARVLVPVSEDASGPFLELKMGVDFLREGLPNADLTVQIAGKVRIQEKLPGLKEASVRIPLDSNDPLVLASGQKYVAVDIQSNSWFVPAFVFKTGNDFRILSYKIYH